MCGPVGTTCTFGKRHVGKQAIWEKRQRFASRTLSSEYLEKWVLQYGNICDNVVQASIHFLDKICMRRCQNIKSWDVLVYFCISSLHAHRLKLVDTTKCPHRVYLHIVIVNCVFMSSSLFYRVFQGVAPKLLTHVMFTESVCRLPYCFLDVSFGAPNQALAP